MKPEASAPKKKVYRLTVSKTKFYKLAKWWFPEICPMSQTSFVKYPRSREYTFDFRSGTYYHHLFLSDCDGNPFLGDQWHTYNKDGIKEFSWETIPLKLEQLHELGMLEEIQAKQNRRR